MQQLPNNVGVFKQWNPFLGQRVGEAKSPGPTRKGTSANCIKIGIINPTSVRDKKWEFAQIIQDHQCDILGLAETSARS